MAAFKELIRWLSKNGEEIGPFLASQRIHEHFLMYPDALNDSESYFKDVLPLIKPENTKLVAIAVWLALSKTPLPLHQFVHEILPTIINPESQKNLLPVWFGGPGNQQEAEKIIKPMLEDESFNFEDTEDEDQQFIMRQFKTKDDRAKLIGGWLWNPANDVSEEILIKLLPAIKMDSHDTLKTLTAWASKSEGGFERLLTILPLAKEHLNHNENGTIYEWLKIRTNLKTADDVVDVLSEIAQRPALSGQKIELSIVNGWLQRSENRENANALIKFLPFIKNPILHSRLIETFLLNSNYTFSAKSLTKLVSHLVSEARSSIICAWVKKIDNQVDLGRLQRFLALLDTKQDQSKVINVLREKSNNTIESRELNAINVPTIESFTFEEWIADTNNTCDIEMLKQALSHYYKEAPKLSLIRIWINRSTSPKDPDELIKQLELDSLDLYLFAVALLEKPDNQKDIDSICKIISEFMPRVYTRDEFIIEFFNKTKIIYDVSALIKMLGLFAHDNLKLPFITIWLNKSTSPQYPDELITQLKLENLDHSNLDLFARAWLEKPDNQTNVDSICKIISELMSQDHTRDNFIIQFFNKIKITYDADALTRILGLFVSEESKYDFASKCLNKKTVTCNAESLIKVSETFKTELHKFNLTSVWIKLNITLCDTQTMIKLIDSFTSERYKSVLIRIWLKNTKNMDLRFDRFVEMARMNHLGDIFDYNVILSAFRDVSLPDDKIAALCAGLFPNNEFAQVDCFMEFVQYDNNISLDVLTKLIKELAVSLVNDDYCLEILEFGLNEECLEPLDIAQLAKGRLSSLFSSIADLLNIPLDTPGSLNAGAIEDIKSLFGDPLPTDLTLGDVFSYYDINKKLDTFKDMVDPAIFNKYTPSEKTPYITRAEQLKLTSLGISPLPEMFILAGYLKTKRTKTPSIDSSLLTMVLDKYKKDSDRLEWQHAFFNLLVAQSPDPDDITAVNIEKETIYKFFQMITGQPLSGEKDKLYELFQNLKPELAFLFSKKDGITNYLDILSGIGHGCIANISMKTKMYVYMQLFKDIQDQYLYPFYCEKIAVPFLVSRGEGDRLGAAASGQDADPFTNSSLLQLHLSPPGMIAALSRVFYSGGSTYQASAKSHQIEISPIDVIEHFLGKNSKQLEYFNANVFNEFFDLPDEENVAASLKMHANMAAYLLLRQVVIPPSQYSFNAPPTVLVDHPSFEKIKAHYEEWLKKAPQQSDKLDL